MKNGAFEAEYKKLNKAQKEAVEAIEGPVMVIAGPGTGKTQVLALRIANILKQTDTPADGVLCLTFTNSGVRAMRERLQRLVGERASQVKIATFHSFSASLLEEFYEALGFSAPPRLLDEKDAVLLADHLLEDGEWEYLRPRSGGAHNFKNLKSLISFLKREEISPEALAELVEVEIKNFEHDPANISTRGPSKGSLKKDAEAKIEHLKRSLEAARFYREYELLKAKDNLADYDDILNLTTKLLLESAEARASVAERYLYVLVDEHQDSSGVQNKFLELVWGEVEKPNLFVVGDDRQLIYGFNGASLSHFESFRETFGAKLITLVENYRSTQNILNLADQIFESSLAKGKLKSVRQGGEPVRLVEAAFPRDEIIKAGLEIKALMKKGLVPEDCAILVPKKYQIRSALAILSHLGLPVAGAGQVSFFESESARSLIRALKVVAEPFNRHYLAEFLLDRYSGLSSLEANEYLHQTSGRPSIDKLPELKALAEEHSNIYELVQKVANEIFFKNSLGDDLLDCVEATRTMLHLALSRLEKNPKITVSQFISFLNHLEEYGEDLPLAVFEGGEGVRVMTLHSSKGLEFEYVWIAHLDENSLMKGKNAGFTLPAKLSNFANKKSESEARRELYVGITRAKTFCTLSYASESYTGGELSLTPILANLKDEALVRVGKAEVEKEILKQNPLAFAVAEEAPKLELLEKVKTLVRDNFESTPLSVTHLNNFLACPWRWYFRNFVRLPEPESEALLFGSFTHAVVEESIKARGVVEDLDHILDKLKIFDEALRARFKREIDKALVLFAKEILPNIYTEAKTEVSLKVPHSKTGLTLTGKIDLLENEDGHLRISDFKTGQPKNNPDYLRQLAMYQYLIEHSRVKFTEFENRLIFLEAKKLTQLIYEAETSVEDLADLEQSINEYAHDLKSGEWVNRECQFKSSQFERECPYCKLAKKLF